MREREKERESNGERESLSPIFQIGRFVHFFSCAESIGVRFLSFLINPFFSLFHQIIFQFSIKVNLFYQKDFVKCTDNNW